MTSMKFHETTDVPSQALFAANFLKGLSVGDLIFIQDSTSPTTETAYYRINAAPTVATNIWTVPVDFLVSSGAGTFSAGNYSLVREAKTAKVVEIVSASGTITGAAYGLFATGGSVITTLAADKYLVHFNSDMIHSSASATTDFRLGTYNTIFSVFTPATNQVRTVINDSTTERQTVHVSGIVTTTFGSLNLAIQGRTSTATATFGNMSFLAMSVG